MKSKFVLRLALVFSGSLVGCSTTPPVAETKVLDYSIGDSSVAGGMDEVVVQGFGKSFSVRVSADSWSSLIQKVKPTFAWNGCDMMWIESDKHGEPQFVLDEAYIYEQTNRPRQWVLLKNKSKNLPYEDLRQESPRFFYSCHNLHAIATLRGTVPHSDHGEDYAVAIAKNHTFGIVYEIGWQREMCVGAAHLEYGRRIYVLKDPKKHWHFLGEGPEEGWERGGGNTVESKVVWNDSETNEIPLQIQFRSEAITSPIGYEADDTNRPPDVITINEYVLAGKFPARLQEFK